MKRITKEQAKQLEKGTIYIIYNPLTNLYKEEKASNQDIVHNKYAYDKLEFYLKEDYGKVK